MTIKRITALILMIIFTFNILTACNTKKDLYSNVQFTNVYKTQYLEMPESYKYEPPYIINDKIYIIYYKEEYTSTEYIRESILYIYNLDGETLEIIDLNFDIFEDRKYFYNFFPSNDGIVYVSNGFSILNITKKGEIISEITYAEIFDYIHPSVDKFIFFRNMYFDSDTNCLYCLGTISDNEKQLPIEYGLFILTTEGEPVDYIKIDDEDIENSIQNITIMQGGEILIKCRKMQSIVPNDSIYYAVNMSTKRLTEYELPKLPDTFNMLSNIFGDIYYGSSFAADYEVYYKDDYGLYGYNTAETARELGKFRFARAILHGFVGYHA